MDLDLFAPPPREDQARKRQERELRVLRLYGDGLGRIPDEAAAQLGADFLYIRPACAILHKRGELRETGVKRKARTGMGKELVVTEKGLAALRLMVVAA